MIEFADRSEQDAESNSAASARESAEHRHAVWSEAAIRLLQGVVYQGDNLRLWDTLLRHASVLTDYFAKIGLQLVVDEQDAMAYLRQSHDEQEENKEDFPRLLRRVPLNYETTLLCVLLRDTLRQFEDEDLQNERCVIEQSELFGLWRTFFAQQSDELKLQKSMLASLRKLEELKFVRPFESDPPSWEIRRIIKARLPLSELERLRTNLSSALTEQASYPATNVSSSGS